MRLFRKTALPMLAVVALLIIGRPTSSWAGWGPCGGGGGTSCITVPVPEIDPASGLSALTLLAGAVLVIRGRRKK